EIVDAVNVAGRDALRHVLDAVEEVRAREDAGQRRADALLEPAARTAVPVIRKELRQVRFAERPAIRATTDLRDDLLGAKVGVIAPVGMAREDALAARHRAQALRIERSADLERAHAEDPVLPAAGDEHPKLIVGLGERPASECDADLVRAGRSEEA